jgi:hypothetical protein
MNELNKPEVYLSYFGSDRIRIRIISEVIPELVELLKSVKPRSYIYEAYSWEYPLSCLSTLIELFKENNISVVDHLEKRQSSEWKKENNFDTTGFGEFAKRQHQFYKNVVGDRFSRVSHK